MGQILKYRHISENVLHTIEGWNVNIGKNSSIGVIDANFEISRVADDEILIHPNSNVYTISGTIVISDNDDPDCYDEQEFSMDQNNSIHAVLKSDPIEVSSDCCREEIGEDGEIIRIPQSVFKYGAILFTWDEWIKCIKVYCYDANVYAYIDKCNNHFINLCVNTCKNISGVEIYICGYDRCGNLLRKTTIVTDIIHTDIKSDCLPLTCENGEVIEWDCENRCDCENIPEQDDCLYGCDESELIPDPIPEFKPDEPLYPEKIECALTIGNPIINIPYDSDKDEYVGTFNYTGYTNENTAIFAYDGNAVEGGESAYGLTFGTHKVSISRKNDKDKLNHTFEIVKPNGEILCSAKIKYYFMPYIANEPLLDVYYPENNDNKLSSGQLLFFYNGKEIVNNAGCDGFTELKYSKAHKFRVDSGTATWEIFNYDTTKIFCKKSKVNGLEYLTIQLIDYNPLACSDKSEIILKNSAGDYFSFFFAVDEGLVKEDEYVFQWDTEAVSSCGTYYSEDEAICKDYYCVASPKTAFKIISYYSLAIDKDDVKHSGEWSFSAKGASYRIERWVVEETKSSWQNISAYKIDEYDEKTQDGWFDSHKGDFTIYIGETDGVTLKDGDVRILSDSSFSSTTLLEADGNKRLHDESRCYIDFTQNISGLKIRLYIVHPGVIKYDIYTDQLGKIKAKAQ